MPHLNPQAERLNQIIQKQAPAVERLLSNRGREIYFPREGILAQSAEAQGKRWDATIGIALEENGEPMALSGMSDRVTFNKKEIFPYAGSFGVAALRKKWQQEMCEKNVNIKKDRITLPVVTAGITHALSMAGYLFVDPGDTVISPDLFWGNYDLIFKKTYGANIETFPMFNAQGGFNTNAFRDKLTLGIAGKKIVLLNFPNNPTGYTPTKQEATEIMNAIQKAAESGNDIAVILDDAYFGLVYEKGIETQSLFGWVSNLHSRILAVKIDGASKEAYAWGLRVGFTTYGHSEMTPELAKALEEKTAGAVRGSVSNASHVSQSLVLAGIEAKNYAEEKKEKHDLLQKRYVAVKKIFKNHPEYSTFFRPLPFNSGYFMCVELMGNLKAENVRKILLEKFDTGVIALGKLIRIAFSSIPTKELPKLFENIYRACGGPGQNRTAI